MSSLATNAHSNMKQVMRTALVGVSPADQLMLKGYLRVLLRLEADLEWVPANHPQVDLLFINEEFRASSSVKKLLSATATKPVLFVKRDSDGKKGGLHSDLLVLPLTQLTQLNDWLMTNIEVLKDKSSHHHRSRPDTTMTPQPTPQAAPAKPAEIKPVPAQAAPKPKEATFDDLIAFMQLVSLRSEGVYELLINGKRAGIASLKRQRIWLSQNVGELDATWQLKKVTDKLPTDESLDLFQWLWNKAWQNPKPLLPLVSDNQTFKLRYWPKPEDEKNRSDLLRIFTALEGGPRNLNTLADLADTSVNSVKKAVAGLLLSGALQPTTYTTLTSPLTANSSQQVKGSANKVSMTGQGTDGARPAVASTGSALDDILARRASGQAAQPISSSIDININAASTAAKPAPSAAKENKRGFLSKLRNKLGL